MKQTKRNIASIPQENAGYIIMGACRSRTDSHLSVVWGQNIEDFNQYVSWVFNHDSGGFAYGVYGKHERVQACFRARLESYSAD